MKFIRDKSASVAVEGFDQEATAMPWREALRPGRCELAVQPEAYEAKRSAVGYARLRA